MAKKSTKVVLCVVSSSMVMELSLIHFGDVVFGGVDGIIDYMRRHGLLARAADCQRYIV